MQGHLPLPLTGWDGTGWGPDHGQEPNLTYSRGRLTHRLQVSVGTDVFAFHIILLQKCQAKHNPAVTHIPSHSPYHDPVRGHGKSVCPRLRS